MGKLELEPKYPGAEGTSPLAQGFLPRELDGFSLTGSLGGNSPWELMFSRGPAAQRGAQSLGQENRTRPAGAAHDPSVVGVSARKREGVSLLTAGCHRFSTWPQRH